MLNSKNSVFDPYFLIGIGPMKKPLVRIIRELKLLSFSWKNIIFFEIFFDHFYGQTFIKTVRGPLYYILKYFESA